MKSIFEKVCLDLGVELTEKKTMCTYYLTLPPKIDVSRIVNRRMNFQ